MSYHTVSAKVIVEKTCKEICKICFKGEDIMPVSGLMRECVYSGLHRPFERHFHNAHELIFVTQGRVRLVVNNCIYEMGPGAIAFISRLEEHSVEILEAPYLRYYLQLTASQLDQITDHPALKALFIRRPPDFCHVFEMGTATREVERLFGALLEEYGAPGLCSEQLVPALVSQLLICCYRQHPQRYPSEDAGLGPAVYRVQTYIDEHFTEPLSVAALARQFYISVSYLSHAFKEWTGRSPQQYLLLCRLSHARELLRTTNQTVAQVAAHCGFGDESNFIRAFKKECGLPPNRYRKENISR